MKDNHDLYLKFDVLLLADKIRNNNLKNYGLSPSCYLSIPSLSCNGMLKITKYKLELIPDPGICLFFDKGTKGRISYISNRYSKANNKYLKSYDPEKE